MAEEAQVQDNPEVEDPGRPEWLPDNFENPEAFAKSYKELQSRFTQETQARSELEQRVEEFEARQTQPQQPQIDPSELEERWNEALEQSPIRTMALLAEQAAYRAADQKFREFTPQLEPLYEAQNESVAIDADTYMRNKYGDEWGTPDNPGMNLRVAEYVMQNQDLLPVSSLNSPRKVAENLERAYKLLKYEDLSSQQQQQENARQQKLAAQTMGGAAGRPSVASGESDEAHFQAMLKAYQGGYASFRDAS